jgi:hypothetical protein
VREASGTGHQRRVRVEKIIDEGVWESIYVNRRIYDGLADGNLSKVPSQIEYVHARRR